MCRNRSFATSGRGGFPARAAGGLLRVTRFDFRWRHGAGRRARSYTRRVFVDGDDDDPLSFQVSRRMSRHAVRATVAVAALSLAVLGSPVQAQDTPSAAQELSDLRARAEAGDASAQYNLGLMHAEGRGVPQDFAEAATWYRKAAEQGDAGAQYHLGLMYAEGRGVPQDAAAASAWFRSIEAEQINIFAQHKLGRMYAGGLGVAQDFAEAAVWFRRGAENGDAVAQYDLGNMYAEGRGVPQDFAEAATWYRKAAEQASRGGPYRLDS